MYSDSFISTTLVTVKINQSKLQEQGSILIVFICVVSLTSVGGITGRPSFFF